jgi:hypothetical protein
MTCLVGRGVSRHAIVTAAVAVVSSPVINSGCCPGPRWQIVSAVGECRQEAGEHLMLGFSQVTRTRTSVAASAPGSRDADGYDRPVTGLRRRIRHQSSGNPDGHPHLV